ncbi:MAG: iron-containing alcohol dehydrogenase [Candidatus Aenigmatarchaeota archaeon]
MLKIGIKKDKINLTKFKNSLVVYDETSKKYLKYLEFNACTSLKELENKKISNFNILIAFGSGKLIDRVKFLAYKYKKEFITIPISLSSDVFTSSTISLKFRKSVKSVFYKLPKKVFISLSIIKKAPKENLKAGFCDAIAKFVALEDWRIANERIGEEINKKAFKFSEKCAKISYKNVEKILERKNYKKLIEAFRFSGLASFYAKSSRPISGSEHNFSHSIDLFSKQKSLHGFQVGLGSIIMRNLQMGYDDLDLRNMFEEYKIPKNYKEIKIDKNEIIKCFLLAKYVRKRYTILNTIRMTKSFATNFLDKIKVI